MAVRYRPGANITASEADVLVNTVNCVGVMGKGVALAFKTAFPSIMPEYKRACTSRVLRPGRTILFSLPATGEAFGPLHAPRAWAAMATKDHWRDPSRLEWIAPALADLADAARARGARSIAIPPPGCGNGGLDWTVVEPLVLDALAEFDLEIYSRPSRS
jgi:O-acetyl-ADP-ribose deacetylase (regulator of RNase III)